MNGLSINRKKIAKKLTKSFLLSSYGDWSYSKFKEAMDDVVEDFTSKTDVQESKVVNIITLLLFKKKKEIMDKGRDIKEVYKIIKGIVDHIVTAFQQVSNDDEASNILYR